MIKYCVLFAILGNIYIANTYSQGCSDAGICTLPSFRPKIENDVNDNKHQFKIGTTLGIGELSVVAIDPFIGYSLLLKRYSLETKFTYGLRSGNNIQVNDFGDVFLINNYAISERLSISAGVKFPIEHDEKNDSDAMLPMAYQSSLGTLDILTGINFKTSKYHLALALQQPITTLNENNYNAQTFAGDSLLQQFPDTRGFKRKGDILLRVSRSFRINEKLTFIPGIAPVYHIDEDEFRPNELGRYEDIEGSSGLTINTSFILVNQLKNGNMFSASLGFPLIVRQIRPDGLTRSFVLGVDYTFSL